MSLPPGFVADLKQAHALGYISAEVALKKNGKEYKGLCPFHQEKTPSFTIHHDGRYHCFGCGADGDVLDFIQTKENFSGTEAERFIAAVSHLAKWAGVTMPNGYANGHATSAPLKPPLSVVGGTEAEASWVPERPPEDAPTPSFRGFDKVYVYRDIDGTPIRYVGRKDAKGTRNKTFTPITWGWLDGVQGWHFKHALKRSLYNLDQLIARPDAPVMVCEGEKAADAAQSLFPGYVAITWSAGSGAGAIKATDWSDLAGRDVLIWPDNDEPGQKAAAAIEKLLKNLKADVRILAVQDMPQAFDAADLNEPDPIEWLQNRIPAEIIPAKRELIGWENQYVLDESRKPIANVANVLLILNHHKKLQFAFARDLMARRTIVKTKLPGVADDPPYQVRDYDATALQIFIQRDMELKHMGVKTIQQAIEARGFENAFHPVQDYLNALKWDNTPRIDKWLTYYLGVEPSEYVKGIGRMFLISMIARIFQPGCKCDYMLVLQGEQGLLKSTACKILAGEWFGDHLPDLKVGKDVSLYLNGKWIIEIAELASFDRAESNDLKSFITRTHEQYRPSYGHNEVNEPRQCVFIGTTNKDVFLKDESGGRRFWPVTCVKIDIDALTNDRDQLFAEALSAYRSGEKWWPSREFENEHIRPQQETRYQEDAWEEAISKYLAGELDLQANEFHMLMPVTQCSLSDVALRALGLPNGKFNRLEQLRISAIMNRLGWVHGKKTAHGRMWVKG